MADFDPNPALRGELKAALVAIEPQIRGLHDLANIPPSTELRGIIDAEMAKQTRRRDLILGVVEITGTSEDIDVTVDPRDQATNVTITLGAPADKAP